MARLSIVGSLEHQNGLVDRNPRFGDKLEHCPRHVTALGQRQRGAEVPPRRRPTKSDTHLDGRWPLSFIRFNSMRD
jgi:hypothetical protein